MRGTPTSLLLDLPEGVLPLIKASAQRADRVTLRSTCRKLAPLDGARMDVKDIQVGDIQRLQHRCPQLRHLVVTNTSISTPLPLLAAVADARAWRHLQRLELDASYHPSTTDDCKLLARGLAPTLRALSLRRLSINADGASELAAAPWRLTELNLNYCGLTADSLAALARHPANLAQLVSLDVSDNLKLGDAGACALGQLLGALPSVQRLRCLNARI